MIRVRYTRKHIPYHGSNPPRRWHEGDEHPVEEAEAVRLTTTFPDWFVRAEPVAPAEGGETSGDGGQPAAADGGSGEPAAPGGGDAAAESAPAEGEAAKDVPAAGPESAVEERTTRGTPAGARRK